MKLNEIQQTLKVPKEHKNSFANYNYRNCEDILNAVKPLLGESILLLSDEIVQIGDRFYVKATATFVDHEPVASDVGKLTTVVTAYAREPLEKKGSDASQITGAASSYARKYALCGLFAIDDGKDPDSEDNEAVKAPVAASEAPRTKAEAREAKPSTLTPAKREIAAKARIVDLIEKLNGDKPVFVSKDAATDYYGDEVYKYTQRSLSLATVEELESIADELSLLIANKNK